MCLEKCFDCKISDQSRCARIKDDRWRCYRCHFKECVDCFEPHTGLARCRGLTQILQIFTIPHEIRCFGYAPGFKQIKECDSGTTQICQKT